jgi:hypothetical protein
MAKFNFSSFFLCFFFSKHVMLIFNAMVLLFIFFFRLFSFLFEKKKEEKIENRLLVQLFVKEIFLAFK